MKINFTKKQFKNLMDLVFQGNIMINGNNNADEALQEYEDMEQYVFSYAKEFGYEQLVENYKPYNEYFPTRAYEDEMMKFIDEYDEQVFWSGLSNKLALRDALKEIDEQVGYSKEKRDILLEDEEEFNKFVKRRFELEEKYENAFEKKGLDCINVDLNE